jgi:putative SOS response-associated peptidase YedK
VETKPAFRAAFARRRCLIPADGWYEWSTKPDGPGKQAWYLNRADGELCVFAGLWEVWGNTATCSVVTTAALAPLDGVHSRMPLQLPRERWAAWLGEAPADPVELLAPPPESLLTGIELRPVGPAVGNVRNNFPELREAEREADQAQIPLQLF